MEDRGGGHCYDSIQNRSVTAHVLCAEKGTVSFAHSTKDDVTYCSLLEITRTQCEVYL